MLELSSRWLPTFASDSLKMSRSLAICAPSYLQSLSHLLSEPQMYMYAILLTCMYSLACVYMYCNSACKEMYDVMCTWNTSLHNTGVQSLSLSHTHTHTHTITHAHIHILSLFSLSLSLSHSLSLTHTHSLSLCQRTLEN